MSASRNLLLSSVFSSITTEGKKNKEQLINTQISISEQIKYHVFDSHRTRGSWRQIKV